MNYRFPKQKHARSLRYFIKGWKPLYGNDESVSVGAYLSIQVIFSNSVFTTEGVNIIIEFVKWNISLKVTVTFNDMFIIWVDEVSWKTIVKRFPTMYNTLKWPFRDLQVTFCWKLFQQKTKFSENFLCILCKE
jgi:hypothetical protein